MRNWINIDGNIVLQSLNNNSGLTYNELEDFFGIKQISSGSVGMGLHNCLMTLNNVGLIQVDGIAKNKIEDFLIKIFHGKNKDTKIRVSNLWWKMKMAIDTTYCGEIKPTNHSMIVYPLFGPPNELSVKTDIFVLMPFNKEIDPIYREHIVNIAKSLNLTIRRADDLYTNNEIIKDVWSAINSTGLIIADCTGRNPNVFYEMGIAHTIGKPVILITQNKHDIPVDIQHIKYIPYEYTPPGMRLFEETLSKTIIEILGIYY